MTTRRDEERRDAARGEELEVPAEEGAAKVYAAGVVEPRAVTPAMDVERVQIAADPTVGRAAFEAARGGSGPRNPEQKVLRPASHPGIDLPMGLPLTKMQPIVIDSDLMLEWNAQAERERARARDAARTTAVIVRPKASESITAAETGAATGAGTGAATDAETAAEARSVRRKVMVISAVVGIGLAAAIAGRWRSGGAGATQASGEVVEPPQVEPKEAQRVEAKDAPRVKEEPASPVAAVATASTPEVRSPTAAAATPSVTNAPRPRATTAGVAPTVRAPSPPPSPKPTQAPKPAPTPTLPPEFLEL